MTEISGFTSHRYQHRSIGAGEVFATAAAGASAFCTGTRRRRVQGRSPGTGGMCWAGTTRRRAPRWTLSVQAQRVARRHPARVTRPTRAHAPAVALVARQRGDRSRPADRFVGAPDLGAVGFAGWWADFRRPLPRSVLRCDFIHADMATELALVSSGMRIPVSRAIFSANDTCAGLAGLEPSSPGSPPPPSALLRACWSRNARQIAPEIFDGTPDGRLAAAGKFCSKNAGGILN